MTKKFIQIALCAVLALTAHTLPAHAGQGTIQETDTQIIIEYSGGEDEVKETKTRETELEIQQKAEQEETKKKENEETIYQQRMERAKRKGALKGVITE
jgi:hypothetical protein